MKTLFKNKWLLALTIFVSFVSLNTALATTFFPGYGVQVKIPFEFTAGDTHLPAGNYTIVRASFFAPSVELRNDKSEVTVLLPVGDTYEVQNSEDPILVFDRIDGKDFLKEVRTDNTVYTFEMSRQEKQLADQGMHAKTHKIMCAKMKG